MRQEDGSRLVSGRKLTHSCLRRAYSQELEDATRAYLASVFGWHSFDHYGQMAIYARMNGVILSASK
jgi:hypothetical protein